MPLVPILRRQGDEKHTTTARLQMVWPFCQMPKRKKDANWQDWRISNYIVEYGQEKFRAASRYEHENVKNYFKLSTFL